MRVGKRMELAQNTDWLSAGLSLDDIKKVKELARISAKIQIRRKELGMNQMQFAKAMGVSQGMISKWESGDYNFTIATLTEICSKLGLDFEAEMKESEMKVGERDTRLKLLGNKIRELKVLEDNRDEKTGGSERFGLDVCLDGMDLNSEFRIAQLLMKIMVRMRKGERDAIRIDLVLEGEFEASVEIEESAFKKLVLVDGGDVLYSIGRKQIENVSKITFPNERITVPKVDMLKYYYENSTSENISNFEKTKIYTSVG